MKVSSKWIVSNATSITQGMEKPPICFSNFHNSEEPLIQALNKSGVKAARFQPEHQENP